MIIKINLEDLVPLFSITEKKTICAIMSKLDLSKNNTENTINFKVVSEQIGVSRSFIVSCLKNLSLLGLFSAGSCGPRGTYIIVRNAAACEELRELCQNNPI